MAAPLSCTLHAQDGLSASSVALATDHSHTPHIWHGPGIQAPPHMAILPSINTRPQEPGMTVCDNHPSTQLTDRPNTQNTFSTSIMQYPTPGVETLSLPLLKPGISVDQKKHSTLAALVASTPLIKRLEILLSPSAKSNSDRCWCYKRQGFKTYSDKRGWAEATSKPSFYPQPPRPPLSS